MCKSSWCSKWEFFCIVFLTIITSNILSAQDNFRVFPYLQNPAPDAMTIIWFSEENSPGQLSYQRKGTAEKINISSVPVSAESLAYSAWENTTYFGGNAPSFPFRHRIRIEDLNPSTEYEYTVTQGADSFNSSFRTAPAGNRPIRFIVYGDPETEPESDNNYTNWVDPVSGNPRPYLIDQTKGYQFNLDAIRERNPDIIFIAGDLVESGGEQRDWDEFWIHNAGISDRTGIAGKIPVMAVPGNHEYYEGPYLDQYNQPGSENAIKRFLTYFESPANNSPDEEQEGRYYSLKYGPVTFIVLDVCNNGINKSDDDTNFYLLGEDDPDGGNAPDFGPGSRQYEWLEEQLAKTQIESLFTFVIFHHAPYSSGPHGYPPGEVENTDNQTGAPVRQLTPLFMKYGVDAVISGHDEIWERSEIEGMEIKPDKTEEMHTIQFYDVGTGGDGLREPEEGLVNPYRKFVVHTDVPEVWENNVLKSGGKHYGHLEVDVIPDALTSWKAILKPAYVFPVFDPESLTYADFERRTYDDEIILSRQIKVPGISTFSRSYPNPFKTETKIEYFLESPSKVIIKIIDLQGRIIRTLENESRDKGLYSTTWDGTNNKGSLMNAGIFFYRIETSSGQTEIKRMIYLK